MIFIKIIETNRVLITALLGSYPEQAIAVADRDGETLYLLVAPGRECQVITEANMKRHAVKKVARQFYYA